jgi:hypothetical protein
MRLPENTILKTRSGKGRKSKTVCQYNSGQCESATTLSPLPLVSYLPPGTDKAIVPERRVLSRHKLLWEELTCTHNFVDPTP